VLFQLLLTLTKVKKEDTVTYENDPLLPGNSPVVLITIFVFILWADMA